MYMEKISRNNNSNSSKKRNLTTTKTTTATATTKRKKRRRTAAAATATTATTTTTAIRNTKEKEATTNQNVTKVATIKIPYKTTAPATTTTATATNTLTINKAINIFINYWMPSEEEAAPAAAAKAAVVEATATATATAPTHSINKQLQQQQHTKHQLQRQFIFNALLSPSKFLLLLSAVAIVNTFATLEAAALNTSVTTAVNQIEEHTQQGAPLPFPPPQQHHQQQQQPHQQRNNSLLAAAESSLDDSTNHSFRSFSHIDANLRAAEAQREAMVKQPAFDFGLPRNITARTGHAEAAIKCRVAHLSDKSVSWIRKRDLHILTVATSTYTSDKRFEVTASKDEREWTLHVKSPQSRDSGIYECQVNTEPKMSMAFQLNIVVTPPDARAVISGPADLHFKVGSVVVLSCVVEQPSFKDIGPIYWFRGQQLLNPVADEQLDQVDAEAAEMVVATATGSYDGRGRDADVPDPAKSNDIETDFVARIAMESQLGDVLKSRLRISNAQTTDTGNYTCQPTTASSASVMIHVINDENPAAMQKSVANSLHGKRISLDKALLRRLLFTVFAASVLLLPPRLLPLLPLLLLLLLLMDDGSLDSLVILSVSREAIYLIFPCGTFCR